MVKKVNVEVLDYNDLMNGKDCSDQIERAYGVDGCGILTVKNVPGLVEARKCLLPLAKDFATLDEATKLKYENKETFYSFGWSHGKEKLQGKPDISKGSYYANPQYDEPTTDAELIKKYPAFVHPNIWPKEDLPQLEPAFKNLGQLIVDVGTLVARQVLLYILISNINIFRSLREDLNHRSRSKMIFICAHFKLITPVFSIFLSLVRSVCEKGM